MSTQEWNLRPSILYKRIIFVLWVLFFLLAYRYFINGYLLYGLIIIGLAICLLVPSILLLQVQTVRFLGGIWKIDGDNYRCLKVIAANQYWIVIRAQHAEKSTFNCFVLFLDQLNHESEHSLRWAIKLNY